MRLPSTWKPATLVRTAQRRWISDARPFQAGDLVLLRQKLDRNAPPILTRPLQPGKRVDSHRGVIPHEDIIGKRVRDVVKSVAPRSQRADTEYRLHNVTLEDYVRLTKRLVTPIYPSDANLIVNLLDLHPDEHLDSDQRLEILEAGTGHGALTLHLSRAIHAANSSIQLNKDEGDAESIQAARAQRRAVIHTTDASPKFSAHAETIVKGFRNGMYARNVDFHVGDVSATLEKLQADRGDDEPFLSHAFLDLPSADKHLSKVADALRVDGTLIVFNPSITQITECATTIKDQGIELDLDKIVELGVNGGSGGREWDVRFVRPRSTLKNTTPPKPEQNVADDATESDLDFESALRVPAPEAETPARWSMVCRPKVGERIIGGGFLGVWRKQRDLRAAAQLPEASTSS